jgi:hypothetical protein
VIEVPRQLRRLSNAEVDAVASDLLGHPANVSQGLLREPRVEGFDNDAQSLLVTDPKLDDFVSIAERVAAEVKTPGCAEQACALAFARDFALTAYGRPLTDDEVSRLGTVYSAGGDHASGLGLLVEAMLLSPHFIYRTELGAHLTHFETASAISFLFTGSRPDAPLLDAAMRGKLFDPEERVRQAKRLIDTDRGRLRVRDLLTSWLDLHEMEQVNKSLAIYGFFVRPVRDAMGGEIDAYLDDALFGGDGTLAGLFTSAPPFRSPILVDYYRADPPDARRGVLTLPGFLAHHSALDHTAPVQRGLFVRTRLLCDEIAPPPPSAVLNPPDPADVSHTNREKYEAHSKVAGCYSCHRLMDPIGFGFESFDALGRFQSTDHGFPVSSKGMLEGTDVDGAFDGPAQLGLKLAASAQVRRCFAQNLWRAAVGRPVELPAKLQWGADAKMTDVLLDVVRSEGFVERVPGAGEAK